MVFCDSVGSSQPLSDDVGLAMYVEAEETVVEQCRGRKRTRNVDSWKKNIRKRKRARGEEYTSTTGKTVPAKSCSAVDCHCPLKCAEKIPGERQSALRKQFNAFEDWSLQTAFICSQTKVSKVARKYSTAQHSRRKYSNSYYLSNDEGIDVRVCKVFFRTVFGINDGRIARATTMKSQGLPKIDNRGRHRPHNKTRDEDVEFVKQFIRSLPTYESHYSRHKNMNRRYLAPDLNISKLYELYKSKCAEDKRSTVSDHIFRQIFNENFSLAFHPPHQDTCKTCDMLNMKTKATESEEAQKSLQAQLELHQRKADAARKSLQTDSENCRKCDTGTVLTFDLQKTLPTPVLSTGICYYKRQLWTYNLGIHSMKDDTGYMYVWNESVASRGPEEIASALLSHIEKLVSTTKLICFSDCCGGQNRNIKIALLWNYIVQSDKYSVTEVDHKFLVSGHTFLPNDQDFGLVEKNKKFYKEIYVPDDWIKVIQTAKKKSPTFVVTELTASDFFSLKVLESNSVNRKMTSEGEKVMWLKIQWIRFEKQHPGVMYFKYTNSDDVPFSSVDLNKRSRGRKTLPQNIQLPLLYPEGRPIAKPKLMDLKTLLQFIPPVSHAFYRKLKCSDQDTCDDIWTDSEEQPSDDEV